MITKFSTEIIRFFSRQRHLSDDYFNDPVPGKNKFSRYLQLFLVTCFISVSAKTQTFQTVPNPTSTGFQVLGAGGALSGYAGTPIEMNNSLVLEYNASNTNQNYFAGTQTTLQLAVYKGGDSLHLIPNPDGGLGVYFQNVQIVYNDTLYFGYINSSGILQLATFDGYSIKLYPNPDASANGEAGSFRVFRNSLYGLYNNAAGVFQFAKVTPSGLSLIPNPDNSIYGFVNDFAVIYNDRICARYVNAAGVAVLATYDGNQWTMWPNPDNTNYGFQAIFPFVYNNKLCIQYYSAAHEFQIMEWDGTNNPTLIANPDNARVVNGGYEGYPVIFNDTLFFNYYGASYTHQLAKFDGTSITLVPSPEAYNWYNGFINSPIIYNNNLYINYHALDGFEHLAEYVPGSNSLNVLPNPDKGNGDQGQSIVYNNILYFQYKNVSNEFQLAYMSGNTVTLLPNPPGAYTSIGNSNGYVGYPYIWNNLLYLQFEGIPYGNAGNLVIYNPGTLPVTFTSFNGKLNGNEAMLTWSTASESNNKGFEVEKSEDGKSFIDIGFVAGHGNSSLANTYNFTDMKVLSGHNYYRLKQVDIDGNFAYSSTIRLDFSQFSWAIFSNPISVNSWVQLQLAKQSNIILQVYTADGKLLQNINKGTLTAGTYSILLNLGNAPSGVYVVKLVAGNQFFSKEVVK